MTGHVTMNKADAALYGIMILGFGSVVLWATTVRFILYICVL